MREEMNRERFEQQLHFLREIDRMKQIARQTLLMDGSRVENDAEHSWHMAVCAMLFAEYAEQEIDLARVLKMALLHDVVEVYAGDTYVYDAQAVRTQKAREQAAAERLFGLLPEDQSAEFRAIWDEFDRKETSESKFANAVDAFMPNYHNYVTNGEKWQEHGVTKQMVLGRNTFMREGASELWDAMMRFTEDAVKQGYLEEE